MDNPLVIEADDVHTWSDICDLPEDLYRMDTHKKEQVILSSPLEDSNSFADVNL